MFSVEQPVWLIPLIPSIVASLIGLLLISFNRTVNRLSKPVYFLSATSVGISAAIGVVLLVQKKYFDDGDKLLLVKDVSFSDFNLQIGFLIDRLGSITLILISLFSLLLMFFSHNLMYRKNGYVRFFIFLGLLTSSMLLLVSSFNLVEICLFWVLIGLFSHLVRNNLYGVDQNLSKRIKSLFLLDRISDLILCVTIYALYKISGSFLIDKVGTGLENSLSFAEKPLSILTLLSLLLISLLIKVGELFSYFNSFKEVARNRNNAIFAYMIMSISICGFLLLRLGPIFYSAKNMLHGTIFDNLIT